MVLAVAVCACCCLLLCVCCTRVVCMHTQTCVSVHRYCIYCTVRTQVHENTVCFCHMCMVYELRMSASLNVTPLLAVLTLLKYAQNYSIYFLYSTYIHTYVRHSTYIRTYVRHSTYIHAYLRPHIHTRTFGNLTDLTYGLLEWC